MSLFSWLFSGRSRLPDPPALLALAASADGRRGAALRADGGLHVWELESGARLLQARAGGPGLALSADGRWVIAGDGLLREVDHDEVSEPSGFHGLPWFVGEELLRVGRGRLSLGLPGEAPRVSLENTGLDPSAGVSLLPGPRWWALLDPHWDGVRLLDPLSGALTEASPGRGPAMSAAWLGDQLLVVQEGGIFTWAGGGGKPAAPQRPHGLQVLAIAAHEGALHSVGVDAKGRYEWRAPDGGRRVIPGPPPPRPRLQVGPEGVFAETWSGFWYTDGGEPVTLTLPPQRRGQRPANLPQGLLRVDAGRALLGLWPPAVYRLRSGTCERILATG